MSWAPWATLAVAACVGAGLRAALGARARRGWVEALATSVLAGLCALVALFVAVTWLAGPLSIGAGRAVLGVAAVAGLAAWSLCRGASEPRDASGEREPWSAPQLAGLAVAFLLGAQAVFVAATMPMQLFDPLFHFAYKGQVLLHEGFGGGAFRVEGSVGRVMTHPNYPPGVPALHGLVGWLAGGYDADATRALLFVFVLAPAAWIFAALRGRGRGPALVGTLLWLGLPFLYFSRLPAPGDARASARAILTGEGWTEPLDLSDAPELLRPQGVALDGGGDLPLAALIAGACLLLMRSLPRARRHAGVGDAPVAGVLLAGAMLAKNEGLALAGVLAIAFGIATALGGGEPGARVRALRDAGVCFGVAALLFLPWWWIRRSIPSIDEGYLGLLRPATLRENAARFGEVGGEFGVTFVDVLQWSLLWPSFALAVLFGLLRPRRLLGSDAGLAALVVVGGVTLYGLILVVTPWNLGNLFHTGIPERLFLHLAPLAALATAGALWPGREER